MIKTFKLMSLVLCYLVIYLMTQNNSGGHGRDIRSRFVVSARQHPGKSPST